VKRDEHVKPHRWSVSKEFRNAADAAGIADVRLHEAKAEEPPDESVTATDTVDPERTDKESDVSKIALVLGENGGVNGTRTRDLRRDRPAF
jgi:hypothetical protein